MSSSAALKKKKKGFLKLEENEMCPLSHRSGKSIHLVIQRC